MEENTIISENKEENIQEQETIFEDKSGEVLSQEIVNRRKEKIFSYFKKDYNGIIYIILAVIVFLAVKIRTRNLPGLKDITTGTWTLGPDLDPFLFLRWTKYIVEHGSLMAVDPMRYVPLGFETNSELLLHPYLMAWFHKIAVIFGSDSVTHSAVLYPAFIFALTVIAFFFLTRKLFIDLLGIKKANFTALIAAFFLSVIPSLLPRTIAGIPEKESSAFLFLFLALYFFISAWKAKSLRAQLLFALGAGIATASMALIWGGYSFILLTITPTVFIAFLLGKVDKNKLYLHAVWLLVTFSLMAPFSLRYSFFALFTTANVAVLFIIAFHIFLYPKIQHRFQSPKLRKIPPKVISIIIMVIILTIIATILRGPDFIPHQVNLAVQDLISPSANSRLIQTVAENRQPLFTEWVTSFGPDKTFPIIGKIQILFWLFFTGSIYLFYKMTSPFKIKERVILTASYLIFMIGIIFSKYSSGSIFNGESSESLILYLGGFVIITLITVFFYYKYYRNNKLSLLKNINFSFILILLYFFISLLAARAAVRLIMVLVPPISIIVSYFVISSFSDALKLQKKILKIIALILVLILILATVFAANTFYKRINAQAASYLPTPYTQQWQKAMFWVRENTPEDAVFAHWWDYGYWVQSIGERATILDGGNAKSYWNHFMGRNVLTSPDEQQALEFLYAHGATHLIIDSTDIGKYSAFSLIGSDENYDRYTFIPTFGRNDQATKTTSNSTLFFYQGGIALTEDISFNNILFPKGRSSVGAVLIEKEFSGKVKQPNAIIVFQEQQFTVPLRYLYSEGKLIDFNSGIESGVYLFSELNQGSAGSAVKQNTRLLYLNKRTINSLTTRFYLFNEQSQHFKLVHQTDNFITEQLKKQYPNHEVVHYQGLQGPIKIWEINYPSDISINPKYLETKYPPELQRA